VFAVAGCTQEVRLEERKAERKTPPEPAAKPTNEAAPAAAPGTPSHPMPPNKPEPIPPPEDVAAPPKDAKKTSSGLAYKVLQPGQGKAHPTATSRVKVHYTGWTTDGKMFDSSVARGQPLSFSLNQVIKGWTEGVQLMVEGDKTRFWIPKELAYNDRPGRPAGMLVFDIELLEIN
jgi:peptidylprolyl isomerase